ncbi:SRPBCC family protein [Nocardioides zeae]|uniref:SRPBCC family protein n=1 Tax=Nocardioides imazamoxiresistens TaxID=3231893 RepID=A0ABU3PVG9_9ACTN|nr:SRPBCC family protein [Nocardioides zeae]MDT9593174.1 SRPBCC family protein [Nocardioides zeae]
MEITRTFEVDASRDALRAYLADFSNAEQWDPGTVRCTPRTPGQPVQVGAQWDNTSKLAGIETDLVYELVTLADDHVVLRGENESATAEDDLHLRDLGGGRTELTYHATITFKGIKKIADPAAKLLFTKVADEVVENLTREGARL